MKEGARLHSRALLKPHVRCGDIQRQSCDKSQPLSIVSHHSKQSYIQNIYKQCEIAEEEWMFGNKALRQ